MQIRNLSRAEYDTHKANFIARLRATLESQNLKVADVAAVSKARVLEGKTDTALSPANVYHYLAGVALPTPKKLAELATVLDCSPTELLPTSMHGRRHVRSKEFNIQAPGANAFKVLVEPGHGLEVSKLTVEALMPTPIAYAWAKVLTRKLNIAQLSRDTGMSEEEVLEHEAAAQKIADANR